MAVLGPARTVEGPAPTVEVPVPTIEGPVPTVEGPVPTVEGPEGPVPTVEGPVRAPGLGGPGGGVRSTAAPGLPVSELPLMDSRGLVRVIGGDGVFCGEHCCLFVGGEV